MVCVADITRDPTSCGNFDEVAIKHIALKWRVDFQSQTICGYCILRCQMLKDNVTVLQLDSRGLKLDRVVDTTAPDVELVFKEEPSHVADFGSKIIINIPVYGATTQFCLRLDYETSSVASALQWLRPEQTAGRQQPYMFSQCQAIHARSLIPCMDTPAVKQTYEAEVSVPSPLVTLMSAVGVDECHSDPEVPGNILYKFLQNVPIPSYLLAIVVGKLEKRDISHRCAVWSEVEIVETAAEEFSETEEMLKIAEELLGPYVWGRYDILVLPPSFPFGGMENPCLTFATPTLLAGDKSLANVIAHEISHSWTGNLVTNATWDHFWLNEGFTTFVERKITGRILNNKHPEIHLEAHRQALALEGLTSLKSAVDEQFSSTHKHTCLIWDVKNEDPDDAFSCVPYEKGHTFLFFLEQKVGGPEKFEKWLKLYLNDFKFKSITTAEWKEHFLTYFNKEAASGAFDDIEWEKWFHNPGMPLVIPSYDKSLCEQSEKLAAKWIEASKEEMDSMKAVDYDELLVTQKLEFLSCLLKTSPMEHFKLARLQELHNLNNAKNSEIRFLWTRLCLKSHWTPIIPLAVDFVTAQGRMKFTRPVYRDLCAWDLSRPKALENFNSNRQYMHNTTAMLVAKDMMC